PRDHLKPLVRDRVDRRLVPGTAVNKHRVEDYIVAAEPGAPRPSAPEAPFDQLLIVGRKTCEAHGRAWLENQVRRLSPTIHGVHFVARPEDDPFLNLRSSRGLQALVRPVEGEITGDLSIVVHFRDAYLTALEKIAVETVGSSHGPIRLLAILS